MEVLSVEIRVIYMTSAVWVISNVWGALPLALPAVFTYGKRAFLFLR